jgi:cyanophycin synthetase
LRGRRSGEVADLLQKAVLSEVPERECYVVLDEIEALKRALCELFPGEVIVVFYEKLDPILSLLNEFGAEPIPIIPYLPTVKEGSRRSGTGDVAAKWRLAQ